MTNLNRAKARLFDGDGLAARNVGVALGTSRDVTPEQIAEQINRALAQVEAGDFELVELN